MGESGRREEETDNEDASKGCVACGEVWMRGGEALFPPLPRRRRTLSVDSL